MNRVAVATSGPWIEVREVPNMCPMSGVVDTTISVAVYASDPLTVAARKRLSTILFA